MAIKKTERLLINIVGMAITLLILVGLQLLPVYIDNFQFELPNYSYWAVPVLIVPIFNYWIE